MDSIFHKTNSIFSVVRVAREEPRRYGKHGELLIDYSQTEEHKRRASYVERNPTHHTEHANPDYNLENGNGVKGDINP